MAKLTRGIVFMVRVARGRRIRKDSTVMVELLWRIEQEDAMYFGKPFLRQVGDVWTGLG